KTITTTAAQQVALDNSLVPLEKRVEIDKCNMRIDPAKTQKEPTYQVVLDALALTTFYLSFLITANMTKLSPSLRNLDTKEMLNLSLKWLWIRCTNHGEPLLQSSTSAYLGKLQMRDSDAYKTYLAYATGAASPKMKRKLKKPASSSKKRTLVTVDEEEPEPAKKALSSKKLIAKRQSASGIELLSNVALLEEDQLKKALRRSKRETTIHQACGSRVPDVSKADSSKSENESWGDNDDEANEQSDDERTESGNEPTEIDNPKTSNDEEETQDDEFEEYERINEELYGNVNVSLTDVEPVDKEKDDEEMSVVGHVNANQEGAGNQVKDDAQATQKTDAPIPIISMMDINVQHEVPCTSSLLTIPYLRSSLDDAMHKVIKKNVAGIIKEHSVLGETVERLRQQYAPQKNVEDIREIKIEHARKQQVPKETITSSDTIARAEFDQKTTLFKTMTKSKSFNKSLKQRALYHALMESILEDKDAMDEGVADKLKKRKPDDAD
ncbi:hypothetical protein Tco_0884039, partial [Tanacetum coccineum]